MGFLNLVSSKKTLLIDESFKPLDSHYNQSSIIDVSSTLLCKVCPSDDQSFIDPFIKKDDFIKIKYKLYNIDRVKDTKEVVVGELVEDYSREEFEFQVGHNEVLEGIDLCVRKFRRKECGIVVVPQKMVFRGGHVGSDKLKRSKGVICEIEVVSVKGRRDEDAVKESLLEEVLKRGKLGKDDGNMYFKSGELKDGIFEYKKVLKRLMGKEKELKYGNDTLRKEWNDVRVQCFSNMAICYFKLNEFKKSIIVCSKALNIDSKNMKVLFRRAKAYIELGDYNEAKNDFNLALQYAEQQNNSLFQKSINVELSKLIQIMKKKDEKLKKAFKGMFS